MHLFNIKIQAHKFIKILNLFCKNFIIQIKQNNNFKNNIKNFQNL